MATNGIRLITPSSVAVTGAGSSATINAGGSVTFSAAESLSLNGVFSSTYDNYIIDWRGRETYASYASLWSSMRLRASGTDASGSNYTTQVLIADGTSVTGSRVTSSTTFTRFLAMSNDYIGHQIFIYGPALAQPTAMRVLRNGGDNGYDINDSAHTHSLSTAYDGFSLVFDVGAGSRTIAGRIKVYGLVQ